LPNAAFYAAYKKAKFNIPHPRAWKIARIGYAKIHFFSKRKKISFIFCKFATIFMGEYWLKKLYYDFLCMQLQRLGVCSMCK